VPDHAPPPRAHPPADTAPSAWGRTLGALLACARGIGLDPDDLRATLGVDPALLHDPDGRVPLPLLYDFVELVAARAGDEHAPLRLAHHLDVESFDALGLLVVTARDLGEGLDRTIRYQRVFAEGERYDLEHVGDHVHVRYTPWGPPRPAHVAMADMFARDLGVNTSMITGGPIEGLRVRLRRAAPRDHDRWSALLGVPAELGAPLDEVVFPRAAMAIPFPRADAMVHRFFERYLDERLARLPADSPLARVRAAIEDLLPSGSITLGTVARRMRTSPRTLQRRLAAESTSLSDLVESVRRARGLALVEAGASLAEIAWMLGYSEPSAFHRAFRRWTRTTPRAWREAHQDPAALE
jgi:AraC-like DNA-binding protein